MKNKYARFFAILKQLNNSGISISHSELVSDFTEGKKNTLKDLSDAEFQELELRLIRQSKQPGYKSDPLDATRKAIIAQFRSINKPPAAAIAWAEKYGVRGVKKAFNQYTGQELFILLQNAKKLKTDHIKSITRKL